MKKILVAIDNSTLSEKVIINAEKLRNSINGELAIISVTDSNVDFSSSDLTLEELILIGKKEKERFIQNVLKKNQMDCNQIFFEEGKPRHIILDIAKKWNADMIVIGTHVRTRFEHLLMGTVAESIIRHSDIPVLIITSKHK